MSELDTDTIVRALLKASGLTVPEETIASYVALYPGLREMTDALYAIPEVRYQEPALIYSAMPPSAS